MNKNRDINMARFLAGEMNVKEEIDFRQTIESDPNHFSELKNMENTWKYFDKSPSGKIEDSSRAWNRLHRKLEEDGLLGNPSVSSVNRQIIPPLKVAASILVILAIGIPTLYFGIIRNSSREPFMTSNSVKGVSTVDLPDGSRVYLNEGSEISYPPRFTRDRTLNLSGEAFFEVMSDPANPFTVHSGKVIVSVLGTSFNIKQLNNIQDVEVYVKSGKVRMSMEESGQFITLEPEEMGDIKNLNLTKSAQKDPNYLSWKTKDFKFVDAELMGVLLELEESYHVKINTNQVDLNDLRITTSYSEQSIDAILETIGTAFGLTVSKREDGYYLTN